MKELKNINNLISFHVVEITSKKTGNVYNAIAIKFEDKFYILKFI